MRTRDHRWTAALVCAGVGAGGLLTAPAAQADCVSGGGSTVCAQGEVRGADGPPGPVTSGPYVPYPCDYDPYCFDGGLSIIFDPGDGPNPPRPNPPRPRPPRPTPR
ncbi:hypothetical protein ACXDF8_08550 [Mycolicibacterium sp. CBM1]